ncbi:MAG: regulatory protein TetR [Ilumatobacteraceae bacterium]|nr:regulatory protein TetR [Ilumatobacteraceae bacterium]
MLDATVELVAEVGVERTSIDEVASRSGVAKSTIYRHFPSKQVLVIEAVHSCTLMPLGADTGSVRDDLVSFFGGMTRLSYEGRLGDMMLSLMDAAQRDAELGRLLRLHFEQRRQYARALLERAVERGEMSPDVDLELTVTLLTGPLVYTKLVQRQRISQELVEAVVDTVLAGIGARTPAL